MSSRRSTATVKRLGGAALIAAALLSGSCRPAPSENLLREAHFRRSGAAADFRLSDMQGRSHALEDYRGKVLLLNFSAPWCQSCEEELQAFEELQRSFAGQPFSVVVISLPDASPQKEALKVHFPVLLDLDKSVAEKYAVTQVPTTFVVDPQGRFVEFPDPDAVTGQSAAVAGRFEGPRDWRSATIRRNLSRLIRSSE
jgi:peroxiredoxin